MTELDPKARGAVLQFEIDRKRLKDFQSSRDPHGGQQTSWWKVTRLAVAAVFDVFSHGGTFVLVVSPDKITMVQRPDAEDL